MRHRQSTTLPGLLALVLLYALRAAPARAEPLKIPLSVYATAAAADLHSTYRVLQYQGTGERNPLGAWLSNDPGQLVAFGIVADLAGALAVHHWVGKHHPRWERVILYGAAAARIGLAYDNYKVATRLQREARPHKGDRYIWPTP